MVIVQAIQTLGDELASLSAGVIPFGLAVCLVAWRALAGSGQTTWLPCAVVTARRPTGNDAGRRR
jgi:hypothetical protein